MQLKNYNRTFYCKDGSMHREDGPAIIDSDGDNYYYYYYYYNNIFIKNKTEFDLFIRKQKIKSFE